MVNVLKELGHPGYTNVTINDNFGDQEELATGNSAAGNPDDVNITIRQENSKIAAKATKESTDDCSSSDASDEIEEDEDNVTKYHFKGSHRSCIMDHDCPEISVIHDCIPCCRCNNTSSYSVAPGEGKMPSNLIRDNDWDINAFTSNRTIWTKFSWKN